MQFPLLPLRPRIPTHPWSRGRLFRGRGTLYAEADDALSAQDDEAERALLLRLRDRDVVCCLLCARGGRSGSLALLAALALDLAEFFGW